MTVVQRTLLIGIALTLAACSGGTIERLADRQQTWSERGPESYRYQLTVDCYCPEEVRGPFQITVHSGEVAGVIRTSSPAGSVAIVEFLDPTIEGLFALIEANADGDVIDVAYDGQLGYPVSIILDPSADNFDDELSVFVRNLEATEG
ncbi:MAG: DUF6174 domain-containing protein [Acidimicrobiia bacterium]|nr:DUF6174 domain-containing protein [Acidimicrobiia bacterium]